MDLSFLTHVYDTSGPFATVYLDTTRSTEDADHVIATTWRDLRDDLAAQGAPEPTLGALDAQVGGTRGVAGPQGQVLVAAGETVVLDWTLPGPPRREVARWMPLPHLEPLAAQMGETMPHVVVLCDRLGADVTAYGPTGRVESDHTVSGQTLHVQKVKPGDWAHKQFQRRSENLWDRNAAEVARDVDGLVAETGAAVLAVAGDVRARRALMEHLTGRSADVVHEVEEGGRAAGASDEQVREAVRRLVADRAAEAARDVLARFEQNRGRHEAALEGLEATLTALRRAQVDHLLLQDDPTATTTLWAGGSPTELALTRDELTGLGVGEPVEVRADAALVRALACTGGSIAFVPSGGDVKLEDGVGALLRYTDPSTPS